MTTESAAGIEPAVTGLGSSADNSAGAIGSGGEGSAAASGTAPASPDGELAWLKAKGLVADDGTFKDAEIRKSYRSLEQHLGSISKVPDEKAKPEEWDAFHKRMGWPGDAKSYDFKLPDNLPPELPYNEKLGQDFKNWANENRLSTKQAQALHDKFVGFQVDALKNDVAAYEAQLGKAAQEAHSTFVKEWGDPGTDGYRQNIEAARRALKSDPKLAGLEDSLKRAGLLTRDGNFTDFRLGHLLASHGKQFLNDSFVAVNGSGRVEKNPFQRIGPDGKESPHFNTTEQARLLRQNPDEARRLMIAAGLNPDTFGR